MSLMDNLTNLKATYDALMANYIDSRDDAMLDELNQLSAMMANVAIANKIAVGSTVAIVEYSKMQRMRHKDLKNSKSQLSLEEMELLKMREELYTNEYNYNNASEVLAGAMVGEITPKRAKELMDLQNIVASDVILKKLEALEAKVL